MSNFPNCRDLSTLQVILSQDDFFASDKMGRISGRPEATSVAVPKPRQQSMARNRSESFAPVTIPSPITTEPESMVETAEGRGVLSQPDTGSPGARRSPPRTRQTGRPPSWKLRRREDSIGSESGQTIFSARSSFSTAASSYRDSSFCQRCDDKRSKYVDSGTQTDGSIAEQHDRQNALPLRPRVGTMQDVFRSTEYRLGDFFPSIACAGLGGFAQATMEEQGQLKVNPASNRSLPCTLR